MSFGTASGHYAAGVELLNETRGLPACRLQSNSEYRSDYPGSETVGETGDESFKFLPYQLWMVGYWPTMALTGNGELGFDSGEGA